MSSIYSSSSTAALQKNNEFQKICLDAIPIIKEAGKFIRDESTRWSIKDIEMKGRNDIVTYVDKTSQQMLVDNLSKLIPDCGFITEEDVTKDKEKEYTWIIDPLDGTTNFVYGIPLYAVSVALAHKGKTVAGIVYEINNDECFYAWLNGGSYLNGKPILISQTAEIGDAILATGIPTSNFSMKRQYFDCLTDLVEVTRGIRRLGSAAVDLCYVASGRFDLYFEVGLSPWDVAAGALIVEEAGGVVNSFDGEGNFLNGREILCGNRMLFDSFREIIKRYFE
ncbi:MAG: inositol monophosphatase [Chitinophagales bacterium]|nr:inositol monophosphatase [Chitinophagales bacterium]